MSSTSSSLNPDLPSTPPASTPRPFWKIRGPDKITGSESEALRMSYAADEAHLKALGWVNFVFALGFAIMTVHFMTLAFQVAKGTILAPWMNMTPWVIVIRLQPVLTILAAITGFGLYKRRSWSFKAEIAFALVFAAFVGLLIWRDMWSGHVTDAILSCVAMLAWFLPMTILLRPGCSVVLSAEYEQVVRDTPYIRVRAKLPRALKIKLAALILTLILIGAFVVR